MATPSRASVLVPDPSDATRLALSPDSKNSRVLQRPRRPRSGQPAQPAPKRARAADGPDAEDNAADVVPESPEDADDDVPVRLPRNSWVAPHEWRACGRYRRSSKAEVLGEGAYARVVRVVDTFGGPDRARKRQEYDDDGPSSQLLFEVRTLLRLRTTADFDAAAALRRATVGSNSEDDGEDEERGESLESGSGSEEEGEGDKDGMEDKKKEAGGKVKGNEKEAKTAKEKEKESQGHEKGEKQSGPLSKKMKVKKEGAGRPSDSLILDGILENRTRPAPISAVESAIEVRSVERTKMDATLNAAKVKAEKLDALMKIAHKLQDADHTLSFTEAKKEE